ncbi:hypothetical protein IFM89_016825 [Coptis chinensis]|uniref:Uncharacterized protein n=1 Tax=Coptis chinensis TaxID=261450 RepID=A0A835LDW0_9MAGN|nr:hypothetical protein IFM89_016825 [Coptis chinensis]
MEGEGRVLSPKERSSDSCTSKVFLQKLLAELLGTYILVYAGCSAVVTNISKDNVITLPGVAATFGLVVMVMVYTLAHISGAHFNPAVTIAQATCMRFPLKQVPAYIIAQILGSTLASGTVRILFGSKHSEFPGTIPSGSHFQSLIVEMIITFVLLFVISGVFTDDRALFAELLGTYIVVFAGTTAIVTNLRKDNLITHPGVAMTWGLAVTVMVYTLGHISQAHFNPAVTIAQATCKRFPLKQVPAYIIVQIFGSTLASGTVRLLFGAKHSEFPGSMPAESDFQSLILEFIITFILLFVISGVSTDNRAV